MKIGICMWYDDNIKVWSDNNMKINRKYCDKYNYDLIKCNKIRVPNKSKHFERYALLYEKLDKYDYLMWIDSDAHFYIDSPPLTNIIKCYPNKLFILSGDYDRYNNNYLNNTNEHAINSGVFIVKNYITSKFFLKQIYSNDILYNNRISPYHDQGIVRLLYRDNINKFKDNSIVIPYLVLQKFGKYPSHTGFKPISEDIFKKYIIPYYKKFNLKYPLINHLVSQCGDKTRIVESNKYLNTPYTPHDIISKYL
tara:strand:- start:10791 stop:11546 length:756 start_codon:yes stop_codon:yes gene_type:complete